MIDALPAALKELLHLRQVRAFVMGESYWKVVLTSGKTLSELDERTYIDGEKVIRVRRLEWLEDIIGSGDIAKVRKVMLCTPQGTAHIEAREPYTAFQFSRGVMNMLGSQYARVKNCQVVGVVTDKETGGCDCAIWDAQTRQLYTMRNCVKNFSAWREGVIPVGRLNIEAMDLRGVV